MNTSKKWTYVLIGLIVAVIAAIVWFFFFSSPSQQEGIKNLFPSFGPTSTSTQPDGNTSTGTDGNLTGSDGRQPLLYRLHAAPVAGLVAYDAEKVPIVRYIERGLGHVYETDLSTLEEAEVSIETIPGVQDTAWSDNGTYVATRGLKDEDSSTIETYVLKLPATGKGGATAASVSGTFLPQNIVGFAGQGNNIFYLVKTDAGVVGNISSFSGENRKQLFSSPLSEWLMSWPSTNTILLSTKPARGIEGHVYTLSASSGLLTRQLASIQGITAIANNSADKILYLQASTGVNGGYTMYIFDTKSGKSSPFNFFTMPEKCTWSKVADDIVYCALPDSIPSGAYPDVWYQGLALFPDSLWRINTTSGESTKILSLKDQEGISMDATVLTLDPKDSTVSFINKRDGSLWRVLLNQDAFGTFIPVTNDPLQPES